MEGVLAASRWVGGAGGSSRAMLARKPGAAWVC